jgi:hypothetical protein
MPTRYLYLVLDRVGENQLDSLYHKAISHDIRPASGHNVQSDLLSKSILVVRDLLRPVGMAHGSLLTIHRLVAN